jgi:hypothetical protein
MSGCWGSAGHKSSLSLFFWVIYAHLEQSLLGAVLHQDWVIIHMSMGAVFCWLAGAANQPGRWTRKSTHLHSGAKRSHFPRLLTRVFLTPPGVAEDCRSIHRQFSFQTRKLKTAAPHLVYEASYKFVVSLSGCVLVLVENKRQTLI